ncbi:hypothetical protein LB505_011941 [Fusarium chuoi]|nr:hypothetical protein LB505_011941 [Fusarium chuoi]
MIDADFFAAYLKIAQDRLRELFIHGPLENEQIVDCRLLDHDYSQSRQAESWRERPIPAENDKRAKIRCTLVGLKEDGEQSQEQSATDISKRPTEISQGS